MQKISIKYLIGVLALGLLLGQRATAQEKPVKEKTIKEKAPEKKHLKVGDTMPAFTLTDQDGKQFSSTGLIGKQVLVIYFYPKDESLVCTKEACSFKDSNDDFIKAGAKVIGINSGSIASHKSFTDHYNLPFTLLSDPDNRVLEMFGVKGRFFMTGRETFVIGLDGKIVYTYSAMLEGKAHSEQALAFVKGQKDQPKLNYTSAVN